MADLMRFMPELTGEETQYIGGILNNMTDEQAANFTFAYKAQRRVEATFRVMTLFSIGRFYLGQMGMGILYVCTFSLCYVGGILDLTNHKKILAEHNRQIAQRVLATTVPGMSVPFVAPAPYTPQPAAAVPPIAPQSPPTPAHPEPPMGVCALRIRAS